MNLKNQPSLNRRARRALESNQRRIKWRFTSDKRRYEIGMENLRLVQNGFAPTVFR